LLYVDVVLNPRFILKYMRFCFEWLYDVEKVENCTKKLKDILLRLYEYYMKAEDVEILHDVESSRNEQDVNVDSMVLDDMLDDLAFQ